MRQLHRERPWLYPNQHYVIDADAPNVLTITASVIRNDWLTVQNMTATDMTIVSENTDLLFRYNSPSFVDSIPLPAGGIVFIVFTFCDDQQTGYFAASAATGGGSGPGGDYLPKNNPTFTGTLTGPNVSLGVTTVGSEQLPMLSTDEHGITFNGGETHNQKMTFGRYGQWRYEGNLLFFNLKDPQYGDGRFSLGSSSILQSDGGVNIMAGQYASTSLHVMGDRFYHRQEGTYDLDLDGEYNMTVRDTVSMSASEEFRVAGSSIVASATRYYTAERFDRSRLTLLPTGAQLDHAPTVLGAAVPVADLAAAQLLTKAQATEMGIGDFLPKDDPTYTGDMKGDNLEVALLGVTGNIAIGDDDDEHVLIDYNSVNMTGPMGESKLTLSPYMLQAGGMYSFDVQSTIVGFEASTVDIEAVTSEHGPASMRIKSGEQMDITAKNMFIETPYGKLEARAWAGMKLIGGDLSTAANIQILPYAIQFQAGPEDEATFGVTSEGSLFGTNPVVAHLKPVDVMLDNALVAKKQVADVLNNARGLLEQAPADGVITEKHFGTSLHAGPTVTLSDLGNKNGSLDIVSGSSVTLALADGHPGSLLIDGVNRGPSIPVPRGVCKKLVHIDGNWYAT